MLRRAVNRQPGYRAKLAEVEQEANKPEKATERQAKLREAKEITREEKKFDGKTKKHRISNGKLKKGHKKNRRK